MQSLPTSDDIFLLEADAGNLYHDPRGRFSSHWKQGGRPMFDILPRDLQREPAIVELTDPKTIAFLHFHGHDQYDEGKAPKDAHRFMYARHPIAGDPRFWDLLDNYRNRVGRGNTLSHEDIKPFLPKPFTDTRPPKWWVDSRDWAETTPEGGHASPGGMLQHLGTHSSIFAHPMGLEPDDPDFDKWHLIHTFDDMHHEWGQLIHPDVWEPDQRMTSIKPVSTSDVHRYMAGLAHYKDQVDFSDNARHYVPHPDLDLMIPAASNDFREYVESSPDISEEDRRGYKRGLLGGEWKHQDEQWPGTSMKIDPRGIRFQVHRETFDPKHPRVDKSTGPDFPGIPLSWSPTKRQWRQV